MNRDNLAALYRRYIDCLNRQDWETLGRYVGETVSYNGKLIGLTGYRSMLEGDFRAIPDLAFDVALLVIDPPHIASRLRFDCAPKGSLFDIPVNGKRVRFEENVFYTIKDGRIDAVWSIIDKTSIAAQV